MKKNILIGILIVIILGLGGYLVYDKILNNDQDNQVENIKTEQDLETEYMEEKNVDDLDNDSVELKNYVIENIQSLELELHIENSSGPEMKKVTITDKEEIKEILLNVDNATDIGPVPEGIGYVPDVSITVNYNNEPSTNIDVLGNGNLIIYYSGDVGEIENREYEISNKSLAQQLTSKYQN